VRPSNEVLKALARALRLDPTERRHLFVLHDRPPPERRPAGAERVDEPLRQMLDSLTGQPAFVLGRRWDVLAWNRAAEAVYGPYGRLEGDERNTLHLVFADPDHRRFSSIGKRCASLAMFRADCARYAGDPDFERLVARLTRLSPEFAQWWPQREVARPLAGQKRIDHPTAGRMLFEYSSFGVGDPPDMKLIVFTPLDDEGTAQNWTGSCSTAPSDPSLTPSLHLGGSMEPARAPDAWLPTVAPGPTSPDSARGRRFLADDGGGFCQQAPTQDVHGSQISGEPRNFCSA
jgi:PAS domain-containing protein